MADQRKPDRRSRPSNGMNRISRFLVANLAAGMLVGVIVGVAYLQWIGDVALLFREPLAAAMLLWGFAASIGMGAVGTGLVLLGDE